MSTATKKQTFAIHKELKIIGQLHRLEDIVEQYTGGRTGLPHEMYTNEAWQLINDLKSPDKNVNVSTKLMSKLFAMAIEMGMCPAQSVVGKDGGIEKKRNYDKVHAWVEKHGYLKKPLRRYTYNELPKLVSIFEFKIYKPFMEGLSKEPYNPAGNEDKKEDKSPF